MKGWVYVASQKNTAPGMLKIGHTTGDPDQRIKEWSSDTGAVGPGRLEYAARVDNAEAIERAVHRRLKKHHKKGEWFKCDIPTAVMAIDQCAEDLEVEVLDEDDRVQARKEAKKRAAEERARREQERARLEEERRRRETKERARLEAEDRQIVERTRAYDKALYEWRQQYVKPHPPR